MNEPNWPFWFETAQQVDWFSGSPQPVGGTSPFGGLTANICFNAVDRHVLAGRGGQAALIYESPVTNTRQVISFFELRERVAQLAGAIRATGVGPGDRVVIYMPMIPETAIAMLACARIGAIHSVVFGGFAAEELAKRIDDAKPVLLLSASCGVEPGRIVPYKPLLDAALSLSLHSPAACLIFQRDGLPLATLQPSRDLDWVASVAVAQPASCVALSGNAPLYILYTSGTTGQPKGIVREGGGYMVALLWAMQHVYNARPGEVFWAASDFGWAVGHSFTVYGPLLYDCTSIIFEGKPIGTPDAAEFWRIVARNNVRVLFAAPAAFRAIIQHDPDANLLHAVGALPLRALFLAGERADAPTVSWLERNLEVPVVDHWWQTETGWPISSAPIGERSFATRDGSVGVPLPGYDVIIVDGVGKPCAPGIPGSILIREPLPIGCATQIWGRADQFKASYLTDHPGYYTTGDEGLIDVDGYLYVSGREDDVLNVAGHRLSSGRIEEIVGAHPQVVECAVIGIPDRLKGERPLALIVVASHAGSSLAIIEADICAAVRARIGGIAALHSVIGVTRLPKTRSGKILRKTMRKIATGAAVETPATIEDPASLAEIRQALACIATNNDDRTKL